MALAKRDEKILKLLLPNTVAKQRATLLDVLESDEKLPIDPNTELHGLVVGMLKAVYGHENPYIAFSETLRISAGPAVWYKRPDDGEILMPFPVSVQSQIGNGDSAAKFNALGRFVLPQKNEGLSDASVDAALKKAGVELDESDFGDYGPYHAIKKDRYDMTDQKDCFGVVFRKPVEIDSDQLVDYSTNAALAGILVLWASAQDFQNRVCASTTLDKQEVGYYLWLYEQVNAFVVARQKLAEAGLIDLLDDLKF